MVQKQKSEGTNQLPKGTEASGTWRVATMQSVVIGGSNKYSPLSVPVSPSPVSREASRDFVALDMWLHTRYQISNVILHIIIF